MIVPLKSAVEMISECLANTMSRELPKSTKLEVGAKLSCILVNTNGIHQNPFIIVVVAVVVIFSV